MTYMLETCVRMFVCVVCVCVCVWVWVWFKNACVVTVKVGPTVRSSNLRLAALAFILSNKPVLFQFSWIKAMDCAEHFCPIVA